MKLLTAIASIALTLSTVLPASAAPIKFASGSYCGSMVRNMVPGKVYRDTVVLAKGQDISITQNAYDYVDVQSVSGKMVNLHGAIQIDNSVVIMGFITAHNGTYTIITRSDIGGTRGYFVCAE